jgi:pimeloyl-[acyl-carrier protein] methyl ester esterase
MSLSAVLIPGWAVPARQLEPFNNHLAAELRLVPVLWDPAGATSAESPSAMNGDGPSPYAQSLLELLRRLPGERIVIGWSTGAVIALEVGCYEPDAIHRMVLLSPTACFCRRPDYPHGPSPAEVRLLAARIKSGRKAAALRDFFIRTAAPLTTAEQQLDAQVADALAMSERALLDGLDYLAQTDLRSKAPGIRRPTLIVHGVEDRVIPLTAARWVADAVPGSTGIFLPGRGHDLPLRCPDELTRHVRDFVAV